MRVINIGFDESGDMTVTPAVYSQPEYDQTCEEHDPAVRWDLAFGCNLSFGLNLTDASLMVSVNMSDRELAEGICQRAVTTEQVRQYALYLLRLADAQESEAAAR